MKTLTKLYENNESSITEIKKIYNGIDYVFYYGSGRASREVITYLKGNDFSLKSVTNEDTGEVLTVAKAIKLMQTPEARSKRWAVNGYPNGITEYAFIKSEPM